MVNIVGPRDNYIDGEKPDLSMIAGTAIKEKTTPEDIRAAYSARQAGFEKRMREDWNVALEEGNLRLTRKIQDENMLLLIRALEPKRNAARDRNWAEFNASKVAESKEKAKTEARYRAETEATVLAVMENRSSEVRYADRNVDDDVDVDVDAPPGALDDFAFANGKGVHEKMFGRKQVLRVDGKGKGGPRYVPSGLSRGAVHSTQQHNMAEAAKFKAAVRDVLAPNPRGNTGN